MIQHAFSSAAGRLVLIEERRLAFAHFSRDDKKRQQSQATSNDPRPLLQNCGRRTQIKTSSFQAFMPASQMVFGSGARNGAKKRVAIRFV